MVVFKTNLRRELAGMAALLAIGLAIQLCNPTGNGWLALALVLLAGMILTDLLVPRFVRGRELQVDLSACQVRLITWGLVRGREKKVAKAADIEGIEVMRGDDTVVLRLKDQSRWELPAGMHRRLGDLKAALACIGGGPLAVRYRQSASGE